RGGVRIAVQPKALDLLLYLLRQRERVVTRQELMQQVWGGVKVQDNTLAQTVTALRRALDDEATSRVVETVRTRGYRFIAELKELKRTPVPRTKLERLIGREALMQALGAKLDAALEGRPTIALLAGAPGLGKTRILREIAPVAEARGMRVTSARCHEAEGAPELWLWLSILRELAADAALEEEIASASAPEPSAEQRFRLFDSVTRVLKLSASEKPLLILLDDLQWADVASLLLLGFVARELGSTKILVLAAHSDAAMPHALARTVGALSREDPSRRLVLTPLDPREIAELAQAELGVSPSAELVERLAEKTGGNPALLLQLLSSPGVETAGGVMRQDTSALLSDEGVREAIGVQLDVLSDSCQALLALAAALGTTFDAALLARVSDIGIESVLDTLAEATRARVLARVANSREFRFLHALVRDVLYRRLPAAKRAELSVAIDEARSAMRS
ncbi:MAG TPA: AAA family ATPase, partial [Polyangiaceae bacterium]|nr:AAA family ATPase [Polyangiaceae bacterium]